MLTCLHCGAEMTNGLALCETCQAAARLCLEFLPVYFRNLARWRPGRSGSRQVPGSRVLYDGTVRGTGTGDRISDWLDEAMTALTTWARTLVDDRPHFTRPLTYSDAVLAGELSDETTEYLVDHPDEAVRLLCTGLTEHLISMATLEWCGALVRDLRHHEDRLRGLTEVLVPGWYAGACQRPAGGARCGAATYVVPGLTWVTCGRCGTTTAARDHLEVILDEARDWIAPPKRLAEAVVALVDGQQSVPRIYARIRKWAEREQIEAHHRIERGYSYDDDTERMVVTDNEVGNARYRLGDVLDLVWTRATPTVRQSLVS